MSENMVEGHDIITSFHVSFKADKGTSQPKL
jgi:hypothetical protein